MSDTVKELCDLLSDPGLKITFSKDCVSGLVGREMCRCWRCRKIKPEDQEPGWPRVAELVSEGFRAQIGRSIRLGCSARSGE